MQNIGLLLVGVVMLLVGVDIAKTGIYRGGPVFNWVGYLVGAWGLLIIVLILRQWFKRKWGRDD